MKICRFENIKAWQKAKDLTNKIYAIDNAKFNKDYRFKSQIQSCAVSAMSNIAEGFSRKSNKEFIQFLFIAKGSIAELQSLLYVAEEQGYIKNSLFSELYESADVISKMLSNLIKYLKNNIQNKPK